ncbi:Uma2 family endonuclease [Spirosoma sp. KUDC1026]|uniref:Uma2 family endonuclease n=1 Tax=Spirosoma sp. KUDC1026 TaxID=2745947 RepID=UPI00159BA8FC|nr:Uma2 family endonuclease [Spirosoma sp. KUDC1026]QKZ12376.1 Uma2 family endonuclease [Spirosoma sp. KUDC1026]
MTNIVFPLEIEPGIDMLDRLRHMTDDEFFYFCQENPEHKFERDADGTIKLMGQTGGETGRRNTKLISRIDIWSEETANGVVFDSSTGFRLPNGATRSPDVAWVSNEQWNQLTADERRKFPPLCPDFVVELMSESDTMKDTEAKMREYMDNGCRLGWLLDPKTELSKVYRANGSVSVIEGFDNILSGEDVLPEFAFSLSVLR